MVAMVGGIVGFCGEEVVVTQGAQAQWVGFFNIGSGQVVDKIPASGSASGQVGVSKNTIGYFRVSFLLLGIFGDVRYFQVFLGLHNFWS